MLGGQPVVHRHHHRVGLLGQAAGAAVVDLFVGDDPAAAVVVHDDRERTGAIGRVDARRNLAGRTRNRAVNVFDARHKHLGVGRLALLFQHRVHRIGRRGLSAGFDRRELLDRLGAEAGEGVQHVLHFP